MREDTEFNPKHLYIYSRVRSVDKQQQGPVIGAAQRRSDITGRKDLERLVKAFYDVAIPDPIIGFFFDQIASDNLSLHITKVVNFWERQIFNQGAYNGQPFQVHKFINAHTTMTKHHFQRWQFIFCQTVDSLFVGENADATKLRAKKIARHMSKAFAAETAAFKAKSTQSMQSGVQYYESKLKK